MGIKYIIKEGFLEILFEFPISKLGVVYIIQFDFNQSNTCQFTTTINVSKKSLLEILR